METVPSMLLAKFTTSSAVILVAVGFLLIFSNVISAAETAFTTVNQLRIRTLAEENKRGARKAYWIIRNYNKNINTILFTSSCADIASTTLFAYVLGTLINNATLVNILNMVVMTIVIIIFAGVIPKTLAKIDSEKYALRLSGMMYFLIKIFTPIGWFIELIQKLFSQKARKNAVLSPSVTEGELGSIIDTMEEEGVLDGDSVELIQGAIDLNAKTVYDAMTPRVDVVAISNNATQDEMKELFLKEEYSRVPVYEGDKDHMIGMIYQKDYFRSIINKDSKTIKDLIQPPMFVVENMKLKDLIKNMRAEKKHMAIVLDEHGGTSGIVTLEDAIEMIVGDIYDEQDESEEAVLIKKTGDKTYELSADVEIAELYDELEIENPPETRASTLGGYLYELAESVAALNQRFNVVTTDEYIDDEGEAKSRTVKLIFEIIEMEGHSIKRVLLTVADVEEE